MRGETKKFKAIKSLAVELKICVCVRAFTLGLSRKSCRHWIMLNFPYTKNLGVGVKGISFKDMHK
jgi:hypothetical protein